jgi:hypothetical protein
MQFSKVNRVPRALGLQAFALLLTVALSSGECRADTAYVTQIPTNVVTTFDASATRPQAQEFRQAPTARVPAMFTPESGAGTTASNFASTLQIGSRNSVYTLQFGNGNTSRTGVIGNDNNVNVLQSGNNLKANVVLMNGSNMSVSVIQPKGSAPVNVLIARLPGGGLLIKR